MLSVENIDVFYGASQALRAVSIEAHPGQITCVLGRNGVGKSSLMRAVLGLQPVRAGRVVWEGRDLTRAPAYDRARAGIGYVPQGRDIFPLLTVEENLRTAFDAAPRGEKFVPGEVYELFPILAEMRRRRGGDLSGGQQQQLSIARALVIRPRLLVLDEPTEGIQPSIIKQIERVISLLRDRGTMAILLVEQYLDFARALADRFAILNRGEVALAGDRAALDAPEVHKLLTV